jgi:hypothetical protein
VRFIGLVLAMSGAAVVYFLGYQGKTVDEMRTRLAQLTNLPGLAPPAPGLVPYMPASPAVGSLVAGTGTYLQTAAANAAAGAKGFQK